MGEFFTEDYVRQSSRILRLLSDETRLRIMLYLAKEGAHCVSDLCRVLELPQATISHHLSLLREQELVLDRRQGRNVIYDIHNATWRRLGFQFFQLLRKGNKVTLLDRFIIRKLK